MSSSTDRDHRSRRDVRVAIIGAGFGGLCAALKLDAAGHRDFVVFERAPDVGGTWQANIYPGAACDAPSHIYSYSFAQDVEWSRRFAPGPEILRYLQGCVERFDIGDRIRTDTEVLAAAWTGGEWVLDLADGTRHHADVLIPAVGQLTVPKAPGWTKDSVFTGAMFHTARWDRGIDLTGKRVAVVGTGASAIQVVPEIAALADHLTVFQRSAPYVMRKPDSDYSARLHRLYRRAPVLKRSVRSAIWRFFEWFNFFFWRDPSRMDRVQKVFARQLRQQISDPELRATLTPDHRIGCKRIAISNDYYPALLRSDVDVVTDDIRGLAQTGLLTANGAIDVDVIVLATGFETSTFMSSVTIIGSQHTLADAWSARGASAYLGLSVPTFPNMFLVYGPNTNLGAGSILFMMETQADHIVDAVTLLSAGADAVEVTEAAHNAFVTETRARQPHTIWAGCRNWYHDDRGHDTHNWHGSMRDYRDRAGRLRTADYRISHEHKPSRR